MTIHILLLSLISGFVNEEIRSIHVSGETVSENINTELRRYAKCLRITNTQTGHQSDVEIAKNRCHHQNRQYTSSAGVKFQRDWPTFLRAVYEKE